MLEGEYTPRPRAPRVQTSETTAKVARGSRRLRYGHEADADVDALLDLSPSGLKILTYHHAPEQGEALDIELTHPALKGPVRLAGRVRWVRAEPEDAWTAGVVFEHLRDTTAVALERILGLELGSTLLGAGGRVVGYLSPAQPAPLGEPRLVVYDADRQERAVLLLGEGAVLLTEGEAPPRDHASVQEALAALFAGPVRVVTRPPEEGA